jgi:DNA polymerase V
MSARAAHQYRPQSSPLQRPKKQDAHLKNFPNSSCCKHEVRRSLQFSSYNKKRKFGISYLNSFGSIKFSKLTLPYFEHFVSAGYPSPIDDPFTRHLDLSRYLIRHPKSTYYYKVSGYAMSNAGINDKDLLVVDTRLQPKHRDIIIALLNGEFILKRLYLEGKQIKLLSANPDYPAINITKEMGYFVQGVVTTVIRTFNPLPYDNHFKDISYSHF